MAFRFTGITRKITLAIGAAVLITAFALMGLTRYLLRLTFELSLTQRIEESAKIVHGGLDAIQSSLLTRASVYVQDPEVGRQHSLKNWDYSTTWIEQQLSLTEATTALMTSVDEAVIVKTKGAVSGEALGKSIAMAMTKRTQAPVVDTEVLNDHVMVVVAAPILNFSQTRGYLSLAAEVNEGLLAKIKSSTGTEAMILAGGTIRGSTLKELQPDAGSVKRAWENLAQGSALELLDIRSGKQTLHGAVIPLKADGQLQAGLVFALSDEQAELLRRKLTRSSLALALVTIVLLGGVGLFLARRISDPILEIDESFSEIAASGDLSLRITKNYDDEVGHLATSFNKMQSQIETLHLRATTAEQRMRDELQTAAAVQEMLFPAQSVDGARAQFAGHCSTSTETGGDWYSILHSPENEYTTCIIADVTGHGAPAALVTAILHGFFKAIRSSLFADGTEKLKDSEILGSLNQAIMESTNRARLLSLGMCTFNHRTLRMRYANAGHLGPFIVRSVEGEKKLIAPMLPPSSQIGDQTEPSFATFDLQMQRDDVMVLFTDGLVECENEQGEQFGFKRLRNILFKNLHHDARGIRDELLREAFAFYGSRTRDDDITIVVAKIL